MIEAAGGGPASGDSHVCCVRFAKTAARRMARWGCCEARRVGLRLGAGWEGGVGGAGGRTGLLRGAGWAGGAWAHHKLDDVLMPQTAASGESSQFCPASRWSDLLVKRGGRWRFLSGSSWALDIPQQHRSRTDTLSGSERALCYTKRSRTISI